MKDPKTFLQTKTYSLLSGNVKLDNDVVPVYDQMNVGDEYPCVILQDWTLSDFSTHTNFGTEPTLTVRIQDKQKQNRGSRANLYDISDQILQLLNKRPKAFTDNNYFHVICVLLDASNSLPKQQTDKYITFGEVVRFRFKLQQIN